MRYKEVLKIPSITIKEGICPKETILTIAIPTYKRPLLLKETLESCLSQKTNIPFAIVIVDNDPNRDCETEQLLQEYSTIPNLSYFKNTENVGMTGNWNKLFELCKTEFIIMLHDDDKIEEDYIEKVASIIKFYQKNITAIYVTSRIFSDKTNLPLRKQVHNISSISLNPFDFQFYNMICITGACFKREIIINIDGFDHFYYPSADYEMHVRLSYIGKILKIQTYPLSLYRVSENESMNHNTIIKMIEKDKIIANRIIKKYSNFYKNLFLSYQKNRELSHYIGARKIFGVNTPEINQKIAELKSKITFVDKLIFLAWRVFIKLHFILKPKTTIKL
ncbi:glycosyltransferase family 2 protein [Capnocytophaga leadbetteri]|uniref:glycosyltransferase family 2 protein n=2 Tax=Capnocytophaga leadbetteri TaxID=327575 RepID=UPI0028E7A084|nr:glycosyltransferase family 2 protein [Capnocytophaga leadbetteri]